MIFNNFLINTFEKMNNQNENNVEKFSNNGDLLKLIGYLITAYAMYEAYKCKGNQVFTLQMLSAFVFSPLYLIFLWGKKSGPCNIVN